VRRWNPRRRIWCWAAMTERNAPTSEATSRAKPSSPTSLACPPTMRVFAPSSLSCHNDPSPACLTPASSPCPSPPPPVPCPAAPVPTTTGQYPFPLLNTHSKHQHLNHPQYFPSSKHTLNDPHHNHPQY
jgi:hypothetical protein